MTGSIDVETLYEKLTSKKDSSFIVVDVRTESEWNDLHINDKRVVNIETQHLINNRSIFNDKTLYVICASGMRSSFACTVLTNIGLSPINVSGGMGSWLYKNLPLSL